MPNPIILASASPRRSELLIQLRVAHEILAADIDETVRPGEAPELFVERMAREKALAVLERLGPGDRRPVLGADTALELDGEVLGKPRDEAHFLAMFARLSGREHRVLSAVALVDRERREARLDVSHVTFRPIDEAEAVRYWASGEPADKAGGYAIQGLAAQFVERLAGSYSGVMGLPLFETAQLLNEFGVETL
ncbi:Maf family protein [Endothiovibrio diazotrophicus]